MPVPGFLSDRTTISKDLSLALNFVTNGSFNASKAVDVLGFGSGTKFVMSLGAKRNVSITANVTTGVRSFDTSSGVVSMSS